MSDKPFRYAVAAICAYEVVAILSKRTPTVSALCARHPAIAAAVLGGLDYHFQPRRPSRNHPSLRLIQGGKS